MRRLVLAALFWLAAAGSALVGAHELSPAFLDMQEGASGSFAVMWKVPVTNGVTMALDLRFPKQCRDLGETVTANDGLAETRRWPIGCEGGLAGGEIVIDGLAATLTDALVRIGYHDGTAEIARLTPDQPQMQVRGPQSWFDTALTYFRLGVDHILSGLDHLLFVFALILLIGDRWMLVKTITAFTVAHSITLAGASLGYFSLPQRPVEAVIALSIAFVASELVKMRPGERRLSEAYPWVVAFSFGLLHGFGFAGALKQIGLPQTDVPLALLTFNLGVEVGQLIFVAAVILVFRVVDRLSAIQVAAVRQEFGYAIGTVAMFWLLARLGGFVA